VHFFHECLLRKCTPNSLDEEQNPQGIPFLKATCPLKINMRGQKQSSELQVPLPYPIFTMTAMSMLEKANCGSRQEGQVAKSR